MAITLIQQAPLDAYLRPTPVVDSDHPSIRDLARSLSAGLGDDPVAITRRCFEWVRDEISHSNDHRLNPVTCVASDALRHRTGFCYAKSHLLAAILRASGIPAGLCYQRLSIDDVGPPFSLHCLNAVLLPSLGWYRLDPRGNKPGVDAQFTPPVERLAFPVRLPGERDFPEIYPDALAEVVAALRTHATYDALLQNLPDVERR